MMMGYFVSRKVYPLSEYAVAFLVTGGVFLFKYYEVNDAPVKVEMSLYNETPVRSVDTPLSDRSTPF